MSRLWAAGDLRRRMAAVVKPHEGQDIGELHAEEGRVGTGIGHGAVLHRECRRRPKDRHQPCDPDERESESFVQREPLCSDQEYLDGEQHSRRQ